MSSGKMVTFSSAAGPAEGFLARPGQGRPGVVVLQEWWGLVPHVKDVAGRFAAQGYLALAPDLYHGRSTVETEEASHLMSGLDWSRAVDEIAGAVRYLRDVEGVDRVGITGFCMGGALTVVAATLPGIDAYVAFYGFPPAPAERLDTITAPGLIFFGEDEGFFSVPDAQAFAGRQRAAGSLTLSGLVVEGYLDLSGKLTLTLTDTTLVPGHALDEDGFAREAGEASIVVTGTDVTDLNVLINRSIVGAIQMPAECQSLVVRDSIVDAPVESGSQESARAAIAADKNASRPGPVTTLERVTVLGEVYVKILELASEVVFTSPVIAERRQQGCVRFSVIPVPGESFTPRRYQCQPDNRL